MSANEVTSVRSDMIRIQQDLDKCFWQFNDAIEPHDRKSSMQAFLVKFDELSFAMGLYDMSAKLVGDDGSPTITGLYEVMQYWEQESINTALSGHVSQAQNAWNECKKARAAYLAHVTRK